MGIKENIETREKMQNHYFEYNGEKYYAGTKVKVKVKTMTCSADVFDGEFRGYSGVEDKPFYFVYYDNSGSRYYSPCLYMCNWTEEEVINNVIEIVPGNYYKELVQRKRYTPDLEILELLIGWPLYIFTMICSSIFNGRVVGWIMLTVIFFAWRHKVKEDNAYYGPRKT